MNKVYVEKQHALLASIVTVLFLLGLGAVWQARGTAEPIGAETVVLPFQANAAGYARATGPRQWDFPHDHGPHPAFQTEWWYYTGNLTTAAGRQFGFQFTIFRRALTPDKRTSPSEWYTNQIYMAHFTVSDVAGGAFYQEERFSRGAAGLAGSETTPRFRVWIEDWTVQAVNETAKSVQIRAKSNDFAIDLTLTSLKEPALHGENGLSQKGPEPGNASYYYSLTRLATAGTVAIAGKEYAVSGLSWMDREFGTNALSAGAVGWDWFALHLSDGRDLMVGQIRRDDRSTEPVFGGLLVSAEGRARYLASAEFTITPRGTWRSSFSGATYPAGWEIVVNLEDATLQLFLEPLLDNQEVTASVTYWEGAVRVSGDVDGFGYAELTGYAQPLRGLI